MTTLLGVSLAGRTVVMVGGGAVTARRLERLLEDGAAARIVARVSAARSRAAADVHSARLAA